MYMIVEEEEEEKSRFCLNVMCKQIFMSLFPPPTLRNAIFKDFLVYVHTRHSHRSLHDNNLAFFFAKTAEQQRQKKFIKTLEILKLVSLPVREIQYFFH